MAESKLGNVESELGMWNLHSAFDSCYLVARRSEQRDRPAGAERPVVLLTPRLFLLRRASGC